MFYVGTAITQKLMNCFSGFLLFTAYKLMTTELIYAL